LKGKRKNSARDEKNLDKRSFSALPKSVLADHR